MFYWGVCCDYVLVIVALFKMHAYIAEQCQWTYAFQGLCTHTQWVSEAWASGLTSVETLHKVPPRASCAVAAAASYGSFPC